VHLTQSAVSMQIKRLEDALDVALFERRNRTLVMTTSGEQLLSYARQILSLNDEAWTRLTDDAFEGEITLGVPHDIISPVIPKVLKAASRELPRVKINLISSFTRELRTFLQDGTCDIVLTTEDTLRGGGETLIELPLVFVGASQGVVWTERPLRLAFEVNCVFRGHVIDRLDKARIPWEMAVESKGSRTIEASLSADLAVHAMLRGTARDDIVEVPHNGALPDLGSQKVNMYHNPNVAHSAVGRLLDLLRSGYRGMDAAPGPKLVADAG
ncbi:MAG: LysR substrate-binding domain-containing protein, partial [Pseudomonadota bacterium]